MTHRDELVQQFLEEQRRRIDGWRHWSPGQQAISQGRRAAGIHSGPTVNFDVPHDHGLDLLPDWHDNAAVLVHEDDPLVYVRMTDDEDHVIHPVGTCQACGANVPLGPAVSTPEDFRRVLVTGAPVGHDCPKR